jgi:hypothetical protein
MLRAALPRFTDRVRLGASGVEVSPYCIGITRDADTVAAAFDAGINFFFVSGDLHWPQYEPLRTGIARLCARGLRDRIVVAGVSYLAQSELALAPFRELVLHVPGLDHLDVVVAGAVYKDLHPRLETIEKLRSNLGARAVAASFHDREAAAVAACDGALDLCLVRYNAKHDGAERDVFPHVAARKAALYNFKSTLGYVTPERLDALGLDRELWRPAVTDHYRFVLSVAALDGVLWAPDEPAHVHALAAAIEEGPLDDEERDYLIGLTRADRGLVALA